MAKQTAQYGRRWYAIHTYSGFEENVKDSLEQRIDTMDMDDKIFSIMVPKEKKIKIKNGKRKIVEEKIFPGYVLVEMIVTDDSWYVVRNTPNVTGLLELVPLLPQLHRKKLMRFLNELVLVNLNLNLMFWLTIQLQLLTGHLRVNKVKWLKSTNNEVKLRFWFQCLVEKHQWNSISYR